MYILTLKITVMKMIKKLTCHFLISLYLYRFYKCLFTFALAYPLVMH